MTEQSVLKEVHLSENSQGKTSKAVTFVAGDIDQNGLHSCLRKVQSGRDLLQAFSHGPTRMYMMCSENRNVI